MEFKKSLTIFFCASSREQTHPAITGLMDFASQTWIEKDKEIESLTQAALKRPNDYTIWWASAGVIIGVVSTLLIASAIK